MRSKLEVNRLINRAFQINDYIEVGKLKAELKEIEKVKPTSIFNDNSYNALKDLLGGFK